jgi:cyclase
MERLADGVYAIIHEPATDDWPHGNTGVIVGTSGVLVIDANYLPIRAAQDIALIRRVTRLPVRYLVNTHWHGDHTHGNGVYRDSFPDIAIIGPRASATFIALNLEKLPKGALKPTSYNRTTLARLEARLSSGKDSAGRTLAADARARLTRNIVRRRVEIEELAKVKVAPPNFLFDDRLALDLGARRVELVDRGRANSPNDVTIYVPEHRILFTGDIVVHPMPYMSGVWFLHWTQVLRELETIPVTALVPGHGPVLADHAYTRLVREFFDAARTRIDSMYRTGLNLRQATDSLDLGEFRRRFTFSDGSEIPQSVWSQWIREAFIQMAECVHGYRC